MSTVTNTTKSEHWDFQRNHDAAHANGHGEYFDARWDWARTNHPEVDWSDMCVFRAQILVSDLPDDAKRDELVKRMLLVSEPTAVDALVDGSFAEACSRKVDADTQQIVILPSAVYFMDGRIRRTAMMAGSYATLTGVKLCRVAGGDPELLLATPDGRVTMSVDEMRAGLSRMMRLEVGKDATTLPAAGAVGPYFTDEDIAARIRGA